MPPSPLHQALRELFAKTPELMQNLIHEHLALPYPKLAAVDSEDNEARGKQLLPDAVLACPDLRNPRAIVIVEVQLSASSRKRRKWPQYVTAAYGRYRCRTELLVVTADLRVEAWAARPIQLGVRSAIVPVVLGPSALPLLDPPEIHRRPALAVLSTLAHMRDRQRVDDVARHALWTLEALAGWPADADGRLGDILESSLSSAVLDRMEELMRTEKYEYKSEFAKKYFAQGREQGLEQGREQGLEQGRAQGRAADLLLILESREIAVDPASAQRITQERDDARLETWIRRALKATTLAEVLEEG
jgi:hypothetical protein